MKKLTLLIDGIATTFRIKSVINFTRNSREGVSNTTCGTTYHLIKSKTTRIRTNIGTLNDADLWQPESFTSEVNWDTRTMELLCSKVRNGRPTYALYDVTDVFEVGFLEVI